MITYVSWPDTHSAPDWVRVPTIEVQGLPDADSPPQWAFTITQHPANQGTRTLPDQQPWERDERRDQLRLNIFAEGWPALCDPDMTDFFIAMAVRQPTQIGEAAAILAELGATDGTATSRLLQGLPAEAP